MPDRDRHAQEAGLDWQADMLVVTVACLPSTHTHACAVAVPYSTGPFFTGCLYFPYCRIHGFTTLSGTLKPFLGPTIRVVRARARWSVTRLSSESSC